MPRLLILCRAPHHLPPTEAEAWLRHALEGVLAGDDLDGGQLTRLTSASRDLQRSWDWLIEIRVAGPPSAAVARGGACYELLADLRLLGMAPDVALTDENTATELRPR